MRGKQCTSLDRFTLEEKKRKFEANPIIDSYAVVHRAQHLTGSNSWEPRTR